MKRFHAHFKVKDLEKSIAFYSALFGKGPDKREADYAKWMLDDPRANIAISARGEAEGFDHIGLQVDGDDELEELAARLKSVAANIAPETGATCCYARSNKYWALSPEGAKWELYRTLADSKSFGAAAPSPAASLDPKACCAV